MSRSQFTRLMVHALILAGVIFASIPSQAVYAASFVVTKTADTNDGACDADCSLREAVGAANNAPGADTITIPAGTYLLTIAGSDENNNAAGDLDVLGAGSSLTIIGAGEAATIIQQTTTDRIFHILSGNFSVSALTITNGNVNGDGGGIYNDTGSDMTINNVTLSNNISDGSFGGGAIRAFTGTILIDQSTFSNNTASNSNGGGAILFGGGESAAPVVTVTDSTFTGNKTTGQFGSGGAINSSADPITITGSVFSNNQASASNTFAVGNGGAFAMDSPDASSVIANSTFTNNSAGDHGGAIFVRNDGDLTLRNVTIASNTADSNANGVGDGGGLYVQEFNGNMPSVGNSILAGNTDTGGEMPDCGGDGSDQFNSAGHNLILSLTGCNLAGTTAGNVIGFDPILGTLADNGGPTQTRALLTGSPAMNAGDDALCSGSPVSNVDQRGISRPQDVSCDIGAYEMVTPLLVTGRSLLATYTAPGPSSFTVTFNKPVSDPIQNDNPDDVTNPANYLVVNRGVNGVTNTVSCAAGVVSDDVQVLVTSVTYNSTTMTATIFFASPLPAGNYTLFICGTTSIVDMASNPLAGNGIQSGTDNVFNFVVNAAVVPPTATPISIPGIGSFSDEETSLPQTGFAPGVVSVLPAQPIGKAYSDLGDIWLEIPSQNIKTSILGVPVASSGWDTTWLGNASGWLNGTAFPTWEGNSVITGHVTNSEGQPGPFSNLKNLTYGDTIIIHLSGQRYLFEVRKTRLVRPQSTSYALEHLEGNSYLTLITCQGYSATSSVYRFRRVVRAALVRIEEDR
ncbi:MAG TPA: sortase [Anaerolineales bacterium]|nr:sortase [Anaerolineales bacterium]HNB36138.1 sortase [Anaerolineales bacterium]